MSTETQPSPWSSTSFWKRVRAGPTASLTHATRWQWYEAAWAILLVALFGTTGRLVEVGVAVVLVGVWLFAPAISVVLLGHLTVIALGILPPSGWALLATEFALIAPLLIELVLLAPTRRTGSQTTAVVLGFTAIVTAGFWLAAPPVRVAGVVGATYVAGVGLLYVQFQSRNSNTHTDHPPSEETDTATHAQPDDANSTTDTADEGTPDR